MLTTLSIACIFLVGLLYVQYHHRSEPKKILLFKAPLSSLFLLTAFRETINYDVYSNCILMGLFFCLVGDVLLAFSNKKAFLSGLFAFLIGHLFYVVAFSGTPSLSFGTVITFVIATTISFIVYKWLNKGLGNMKFPVLLYIIAITAMVTSAGSFFMTDSILYETRILVFVGAILFYLSDIFVARNKFKIDSYVNKIFGLPIYYIAQFMIAYSI